MEHYSDPHIYEQGYQEQEVVSLNKTLRLKPPLSCKRRGFGQRRKRTPKTPVPKSVALTPTAPIALLPDPLIITFVCGRYLLCQIIGILSLLVLLDQIGDDLLGFVKLAESVFEGRFAFVGLEEGVSLSECIVLCNYAFEQRSDTGVIGKHKT
jgi:hypothetical protein